MTFACLRPFAIQFAGLGKKLSFEIKRRSQEKMYERILDRITSTPAGGHFVLLLMLALGSTAFCLYWTLMDEVPIWAYKVAVLYFAARLFGAHVGRKKD
jgi:hypothetical protein